MSLAQRIGQEFKTIRDNELSTKVDKISGKGLSTEDYSTTEKTKLTGIEAGAQVNDANTTLQGNTFNGVSQLVQTDGAGKLPAIDGSQLTGVSSVGSIDDLTDVDTSTVAPSSGDVLEWNGVNWVPLSGKKLWQNQATTITPTANADYTLTADQNTYGRLKLVNGSWLSAHNIIVDNTKRSFLVDNSAGTYTATVKTSAGAGIAVLAGTKVWLLCDGTNVINSGLAPLASPALTGTPTAPSFSYKPTPTAITSWSYVATTITLNVASHTFVAGDYIEVGGLTATTNSPNGVRLVTSVTATTIVFTYPFTPTGTAGVSSATVKGYMTTNGRVEGIGVGQVLTNVLASRAASTTYYNTTGKPIVVHAWANNIATTGGTGIQMTVNWCTIQNIVPGAGLASNNASPLITAVVPAMGLYSVNLISSTLAGWIELR